MTSNELHWLAGLLEGEGCFTTSKHPKRGTSARATTVAVCSTDADVVERAAALMGTKTMQRLENGPRATRALYRASVYGHAAAKLMLRVLPLMGARRQQRIKELLQSYLEQRPGHFAALSERSLEAASERVGA